MNISGRGAICAAALSLALVSANAVSADAPASLDKLAVPLPTGLDGVVANRSAAIALGKALFWDTQVGSDAEVACATCHHQAGVDARTTNTLNPGHDGFFSVANPGDTLVPGDFPHGTDDIVGSGGVDNQNYVTIQVGNAHDIGIAQVDPVFGEDRQVTGRQAPSAINAIFNERNFWDGRARTVFNGVNILGKDDPTAVVYVNVSGVLTPKALRLSPASAASQAVGPPTSGVEMSWAGRSWPELGRKMLSLRPLAQQAVSDTDSVLQSLRQSGPGATGLATTYRALIQSAFKSKYWNSSQTLSLPTQAGPVAFEQIEANFSMFWGIAVMLYESTLVSSDSPFDRYARGESSLSAQALQGLALWDGEARCDQCHGGPAFTNAAIGSSGGGRKFANAGVRPVSDDAGLERGRFKVPTLRNTELSGPYFHNGGYATLRQVVEFYNRGGDFPGDEVDSQVRPLGLSDTQLDSLVAFLVSLTDDRVRYERAPFDHPELPLPDGATLSAVGAGGRGAALTPYLGLDPFSH
jgi:cytochrome c peroxidase